MFSSGLVIRLKLFDKKFGKDFLSTVPRSPGVYFLWDDADKLLYVGKAVNLRVRLSQYRRAKRGEKSRKLVELAVRVTWESCESDLQACLREVELIQQLRPKKNVTAAYSFLYPLIGLKAQSPALWCCLTTVPVLNPNFTFHGAYRSRETTGSAFFALMRLLKYLGHPEKRDQEEPSYTYLFGFRRLPDQVIGEMDAFLRGRSEALLQTLFAKLLNHAGARQNAGQVKEDLRSLRTFWEEEAVPLCTAIERSAYPEYPVAQTDRDPVFLKANFLKGS
jgi:excinuclease UvrABC nuclease subunit